MKTTVETERLLLRPFRTSDAGDCFTFLSDRETDVQLVTAGAADCNDPSIAMLEKLGFVREGIIRKGFFIPGRGPVDMVSFYRERT